MHVWLTVRRRLLTCSQIGFVGLFFLCLLAPFQAYADPLTVTVGPDQPFVDWTVTFEEGDILDMKVSTGIDCPLDFAVTPDPYVQLLDESMGVDYQDDDGAHNDVGIVTHPVCLLKSQLARSPCVSTPIRRLQ